MIFAAGILVTTGMLDDGMAGAPTRALIGFAGAVGALGGVFINVVLREWRRTHRAGSGLDADALTCGEPAHRVTDASVSTSFPTDNVSGKQPEQGPPTMGSWR